MTLKKSQWVPVAFWLGFISLGLVTNFVGARHPRGAAGVDVARSAEHSQLAALQARTDRRQRTR